MSKHVVSETDTVAETEFFQMSDEADCVGVDRPLGEAVSGGGAKFIKVPHGGLTGSPYSRPRSSSW